MDKDIEYIITQMTYHMQNVGQGGGNADSGDLGVWANVINAAIRLNKKIPREKTEEK